MSDVKWIKIATDIFDDEKILLIESMPDADAIIVIWFKLLCMAGKQNNSGVFMLNDRIPYTDEMLATIFRRNVNTVRLALATFEQYGMIEIVNDTITIPNWGKHQQLDALEMSREKTRNRVAAFRAKQRKLMESPICQYCGEPATGYDHILATARGGKDVDENKVPCCIRCNRIKNDKPLVDFLNSNRDIVKDEIVTRNPKLAKFVTLRNATDRYEVTVCNADRIREEKNKNIYKDDDNVRARAREYDTPEEAPNAFGDADYRPNTGTIQQYVTNSVISMSARAMEQLNDYLKDLPEPVVRHGVDNALDAGKRTWNYIRAILNSYVDAGVKTVQEAVDVDKQHNQRYAQQERTRPIQNRPPQNVDNRLLNMPFTT